MIEAATKKKRTISADVMDSVAEFVPMDGLKIGSDILGQEYTVVDVIEGNFNGRKTFTAVLKNEERVLNVSAGVLKRARILGSESIEVKKFFNNNEGIVLRSEANAIWDNSRYFHAEQGMSQGDEYTLPEKVHIEFAVISERSGTDGKMVPAHNPFLYEGYRQVVNHYQKEGKFPTFAEFEEELKKEGDARIPGLPATTVPTLFSYVKGNDPSTMRYNLIFKDIKD